MAENNRDRQDENTPEELKGRPEGQPGMSDYDESGGTGLDPNENAQIGGGTSGGDSDPIRERVNERTTDDTR